MERQSQIIALLQSIDASALTEDNSASLIESGLIDSLSIVQIIGEIEDTFDIELGDEDMTIENFATVIAIDTLVSKYLDK